MLAAAVGAAYLVLVAVDARPIADDWWFISDARHWSFAFYMQQNLGSSGRFSQFALSWLSSRLFGYTAVQVVPLILLTAATWLAAWMLVTAATALNRPISNRQAASIALMAVVAIVATAPSIYDTVAWYAAVVAYLAGFTGAIALVALCVSRLTATRPATPIGTTALFLLGGISGGFHELVGAVLVLAGLLAMVTGRALLQQHSRRELLVPLGAATFGSAVGTAANILGPGAQSRAHAQGAHVSVGAAVQTAANNISFLRSDLHDGVLLLAIALGVVVWQALGPIDNARLRRWLWAWAVFLLIGPWTVTAAFTAWGGSTESGDRSPFRAAFLATGSVSLAIALVVWILLSTCGKRLSQNRAVLPTLVLALGGTIGFAHHTTPILRAEALRAEALDTRGSAIRDQLAAGRRTIALFPAPLLTVLTQAYDLSFAPANRQRPGWLQAATQFYGIPGSDAVRVISTQPRTYCLPGVSAPWVGVQSCQELHAHG